jgi:hypothetical protein
LFIPSLPVKRIRHRLSITRSGPHSLFFKVRPGGNCVNASNRIAPGQDSVSVDLDQIADAAVLAQSVNPFCKNIKVLEPW